MESTLALVMLVALAVPVATVGVGMIDQRPKAGPALMWGGIGAIVAAECGLFALLLLF